MTSVVNSLSLSLWNRAVDASIPVAASVGIGTVSNHVLGNVLNCIPKLLESKELVIYKKPVQVGPILTKKTILGPLVEELLLRGVLEITASSCFSMLSFSYARILAALAVACGLEIHNKDRSSVLKSLHRLLTDLQYSLLAIYFGLPGAMAAHMANQIVERIQNRFIENGLPVEKLAPLVVSDPNDHLSDGDLEEELEMPSPLQITSGSEVGEAPIAEGQEEIEEDQEADGNESGQVELEQAIQPEAALEAFQEKAQTSEEKAENDKQEEKNEEAFDQTFSRPDFYQQPAPRLLLMPS
jgi:hypothetical protein